MADFCTNQYYLCIGEGTTMMIISMKPLWGIITVSQTGLTESDRQFMIMTQADGYKLVTGTKYRV